MYAGGLAAMVQQAKNDLLHRPKQTDFRVGTHLKCVWIVGKT